MSKSQPRFLTRAEWPISPILALLLIEYFLINSCESAFAKNPHWMDFLYAVHVIVATAAGILTSLLWKTRDRKLAEISEQECRRRNRVFYSWLFAYVLAFGSVILNPNCIFSSNLIYSVYFIIGFCLFLYGYTRLPLFFDQKGKIRYLMNLLFGPLLILSVL